MSILVELKFQAIDDMKGFDFIEISKSRYMSIKRLKLAHIDIAMLPRSFSRPFCLPNDSSNLSGTGYLTGLKICFRSLRLEQARFIPLSWLDHPRMRYRL